MSEIIHDSDCALHNAPALPAGACDCEAGRIAKVCENMTAHEAEIVRSWAILESFGFPPVACGYPDRDIAGLLPEAIKCAMKCIIRQREDLLAEVLDLRAPVAQTRGQS